MGFRAEIIVFVLSLFLKESIYEAQIDEFRNLMSNLENGEHSSKS